MNNTTVPGSLVLVVDDNPRNLKLARDVLLAAGFRTLEAGTAGEGLALAVEHLPDVILMDIRLPDMDGTDAVRRLAAGTRTATIPVVAFSSLPLEGQDAWLRRNGFAGSIAKPISIEDFPEQLRAFCRG